MLTHTLYREDILGNRFKLETFDQDEDNSKALAEEMVDNLEAQSIWPEGHNAVLVSSHGDEWLYTDTWEEL